VPYAAVSPAQVMDIYLPEGDGPFPVVVLIHGGAFRMGDKGMETANAKALVAKANPTTYISADDAAFFIQVGSMDRNISLYTEPELLRCIEVLC